MTIESCYEKFLDAKINQKSLYSDSHFIWGYKLRLKVHLNEVGNARQTHMSVFLEQMNNGDYTKPFEKTVEFILIHQDDQSKCIRRAVQARERGRSIFAMSYVSSLDWGFARFITLKELHDGGFIKNDLLYIRCVVEQ